MADDVPLKRAVDTAWSVFRASRDGVDAADSRRCLLERHLRGRWVAREDDAEELASFGIAYLARVSEGEW